MVDLSVGQLRPWNGRAALTDTQSLPVSPPARCSLHIRPERISE